MGTIFVIAIALFLIAAIVAFVLNKNKEKKYEGSLSEDIVKTKKLYKGSMACYIDSNDCKTILRYFVSGKTNTLADFIPSDEILVNNCLILFDEHRKKLSIIQDIRKHGMTKTLLFSDVQSLEPVEISKTKKVTRGGISLISIGGYRWASSTTKMLKQIERVYIEIKYNAYNQEKTFELPIFDGISYNDRDDYAKVVETVNSIINKFHDIISASPHN